MKLSEILSPSFRTFQGRSRERVDWLLPSQQMVRKCQADAFAFFQPFLDRGLLTAAEATAAATRYHLGKSKSGKPIFWMIDEMQQVLDGRIGDSWVSSQLKTREPLLQYWQPTHCLFGLHLLYEPVAPGIGITCQKPVCIVESEISAVVLSALYPDCLWLAYGYPANMTIDRLDPLQCHDVSIYPRTDPFGETYLSFLELADQAMHLFHRHFTVESLLEDHATPDQKARHIDLLDFYLESAASST